MRRKFDLDLTSLDRLMVLIHGAFNTGKTHLQGDFLRWVKDRGGKIAFINIAGETGYSTIAGMGLGAVGETAETLTDFDEIVQEYSKQGYDGVAVDSLSAFGNLVLKDLMGEVRYPDPKLDGERAKMLWGQIKMRTMGRVQNSRSAGKIILWVSPYDKSQDDIGSRTGITPDLPTAKMSWSCGGWFDFVGLLQVNQGSSPEDIKRTVTFAPGAGVLTRQRVPRIITKPIVIPKDRGGWAAIYQAMQEALTPTQEAKK